MDTFAAIRTPLLRLISGRECVDCHEVKPPEQFYTSGNRMGPDGPHRSRRCIRCTLIAQRKRRMNRSVATTPMASRWRDDSGGCEPPAF